MDNCTRCQRTTTLLVECRDCHETYCEAHRSPTDHDCRGPPTDGRDRSRADGTDREPVGEDPAPTDLYPAEAEPPAGRDTDAGDEGGSEEPPAGMDFDPTAKVDRLLRTAVVVGVLVVGFGAGGFLWMGPGTDAGALDGGSASTAAATEDLNTTRAERLVHEYTNRERREAGVDPIEYDAELAAISEHHSRDMAEHGYVGHTSPEGETIADRYREFGYDCDATGEILQWLSYEELDSSGETALARAIVGNWMDSALHRSFVLNGSWTHQGVGVDLADSGRVYVTQNTCGTG